MPSRREGCGLLRGRLVSLLHARERGGPNAAAVEAPVLYRATITHLRRGPAVHRFQHRSFLWLIDSDFPPRMRWPLGPLARFEPGDHADIRAVLADHGLRASRILVLTTPRTLGYVFNPLSVYWCYRDDGSLAARVAEVHNTHGQRHAYVLPPDGIARVDKELAVSPFHPRHGTYRMRISDPGPRLAVAVSLHPERRRCLHCQPGGRTGAGLHPQPIAAPGSIPMAQPARRPTHPLRSGPIVGETDPPAAGMTQLDRFADPLVWLAEPTTAPSLRVAAANAFMRRAALRCGVQVRFPDGTVSGSAAGPVMSIRNYHALASRLATSGEIGFGEAYMAGDWDSPDLVDLLEAILRRIWTVVPRPLAVLRRLVKRPNPHHQDNDLDGARRNVAHHYDLSNELFAQFLDETMTYSAALFKLESDSLAVAQGRKVERLLDATGVGPGVRLLEIGTGWGELAIRAACRGAQVTTITLSHQQAELTRSRVAAAGLERRVEVREQDYRQVTGRFDAIISVEMIEAVGRSWWPTYFQSLDQHLAAGGRVGLQSILMDHHRMLDASGSWTWTRKYVYPGGVIPSQTAIETGLARHTTLRVVDCYHFGASYARTLREWRERFSQHRDQLLRLGFDPAFQRMWNYYLAQSQAAFQAGYLDVGQLILTHTEAKP